MRLPFSIGGSTIEPGTRKLVVLPLSKLANHTPMTLPVHVLHGAAAGPTLFVSGAIHGDEINGVEIIRRLIRLLEARRLCGTVLCVPIVNAYGFIGRSRYLPDRRDLNRSFPGAVGGSLAARLAHLFMSEIVMRSDFGVDLHTAAVHRINLPQIRSGLLTLRAREFALAFGAPVIVRSAEREGSLRQAAAKVGIDVLVYEGGEGLRFDELPIRAGVDGILALMHKAGMLAQADDLRATPINADVQGVRPPVIAEHSTWVRAPEGGVFRTLKRIGDAVGAGESLGVIANPYEVGESDVRCKHRGIIIGATTLPTVNMGDALFHIAWGDEMGDAPRPSRRPAVPVAPVPVPEVAEPLMDEDEII